MNTYWFEVTDENNENYGEQFFVEADDLAEAWVIAMVVWDTPELHCYGKVTPMFAELMGLDTY